MSTIAETLNTPQCVSYVNTTNLYTFIDQRSPNYVA